MRGRGLTGWMFLLAAGYLAYQSISEQSPAPPAPNQTPTQAAPPGHAPRQVAGEKPRSGGYALRAESTWPPLTAGQDQQPAKDLLAVNYYVVLDGSGSMNERNCAAGQTKMDAARKALASFAQSVPAGANLGLAVFENRGLMELLPLGTGNREQFGQAVRQVAAGGGTPLSTAVQLAYERLLAQGRAQLGYGEYHLVVVTDGLASDGYDPTPKVNEILNSSPVMLHTIGFCIGTQHSLNQPGRTFYQAADNPEALRQGLDAVLAESPSFDLANFRDRLGP